MIFSSDFIRTIFMPFYRKFEKFHVMFHKIIITALFLVMIWNENETNMWPFFGTQKKK